MLEYKASKEGRILLTAYQGFVKKHAIAIEMPQLSESLRLMTHHLETLINGPEKLEDCRVLLGKIIDDVPMQDILEFLEGCALQKAEEKTVKLASLLQAGSVVTKGVGAPPLAERREEVKKAVACLRRMALGDRSYLLDHLQPFLPKPTKACVAALELLAPKVSGILVAHIYALTARIDLTLEKLAEMEKTSVKEESAPESGQPKVPCESVREIVESRTRVIKNKNVPYIIKKTTLSLEKMVIVVSDYGTISEVIHRLKFFSQIAGLDGSPKKAFDYQQEEGRVVIKGDIKQALKVLRDFGAMSKEMCCSCNQAYDELRAVEKTEVVPSKFSVFQCMQEAEERKATIKTVYVQAQTDKGNDPCEIKRLDKAIRISDGTSKEGGVLVQDEAPVLSQIK